MISLIIYYGYAVRIQTAAFPKPKLHSVLQHRADTFLLGANGGGRGLYFGSGGAEAGLMCQCTEGAGGSCSLVSVFSVSHVFSSPPSAVCCFCCSSLRLPRMKDLWGCSSSEDRQTFLQVWLLTTSWRTFIFKSVWCCFRDLLEGFQEGSEKAGQSRLKLIFGSFLICVSWIRGLWDLLELRSEEQAEDSFTWSGSNPNINWPEFVLYIENHFKCSGICMKKRCDWSNKPQKGQVWGKVLTTREQQRLPTALTSVQKNEVEPLQG